MFLLDPSPQPLDPFPCYYISIMFQSFADYITYGLLHLEKGTRLAGSVNFFFYDLPKIYFMLICVVFAVAVIRTFFPPERIKKILTGRWEITGYFLSATLGIFMPFCTCSAIPLFLGMIESGIPLGVTMSFLIASPTINEIAVVLLWGLFGWRVSLIYILSGMIVAITAGFIIGRLKMENYVNKEITNPVAGCEPGTEKMDWPARIRYAYAYTVDILLYIWLYVLIGIFVGALIHGYIPGDLLAQYAGKGNPFAVIIAVLIGVPIYANCAGAIPVAQALMEKGLPLGTSLAFLMAVTGLSLPEFLILSKVMKMRLLLTFFGTVALGIILIGYFFNFIF